MNALGRAEELFLLFSCQWTAIWSSVSFVCPLVLFAFSFVALWHGGNGPSKSGVDCYATNEGQRVAGGPSLSVKRTLPAK